MMIRDLAAAVRAEATVQSRRPALGVILGVGCLLMLTFAYIIPAVGADGGPGEDRALSSMLPEQFLAAPLGPLPVFAGALALTAGALIAGSEHVEGTWTTVFVQQPRRLVVHGGKLIAVTAFAAVMLVLLFGVAAAASLTVALIEGMPVDWPPIVDVVRAYGTGWLALTMWGAVGALLATAARSVALPIGIGLVWILAVQNLLSVLAAPLLSWYAEAQWLLPGPAVGSVVAAVGAANSAPGVQVVADAGPAALVLVCYLLTSTLISGWLVHHRDVC
ncbi:ABC transporter permease [Nesterenkonia halobia]|uniref:ABC transporter permease n=1 Tax=Nesterenkonia halobia TaxID=37922 RepID=A0ABP6RDF7_9MICC